MLTERTFEEMTFGENFNQGYLLRKSFMGNFVKSMVMEATVMLKFEKVKKKIALFRYFFKMNLKKFKLNFYICFALFI